MGSKWVAVLGTLRRATCPSTDLRSVDLAYFWINRIRIKVTLVFLSDQLSEEGDESKMPAQQPSTESPNGLRVISTRKSVTSSNQDKGKNRKYVVLRLY